MSRLRTDDIQIPRTLAEADAAIVLAEHILEEIDESEKSARDDEHRSKIATARAIWKLKLTELEYWEERLRAGDSGPSLELKRERDKSAKLEREVAELRNLLHDAVLSLAKKNSEHGA